MRVIFEAGRGAMALGLLMAALATPAGAQERRPLGTEADRVHDDSLAEHRRQMEMHQREMERHRAEMERHAAAMSGALLRAHSDSGGRVRMYRRDGAFDSAHSRYLYRTSMRTSCARMGIAFSGDDTVVVEEVMPNSGAAEAGVRTGDVILSVNGERADARRMMELAEGLEADDRVRLVVRRGGREQTLEVTAREDVCPYRTMLSETPFRVMCVSMDSTDAEDHPECEGVEFRELRRNLAELGENMQQFRMHAEQTDSGTWLRFGPHGTDSLFIDLDSVRILTDGLALQLDSIGRLMPFTYRMADSLAVLLPRIELNMKEADEAMHAHGLMLRSMELGARALAGAQLTDLNDDLAEYFRVESGALVTAVEDGSPAARAGLEGGDVIVSVNGNAVSDVGDVRRHAVAEEGDIELTVVRKGERRTIRLPR